MTRPESPFRASLGHTHDPTVLVPGDPAEVQLTAISFDRFGTALAAAGDGLQRIDSGGWTGHAADQFHAAFTSEPGRWATGGQAFASTAEALHDYARTLAWAQGQAAEAIARWDQGQAQTRQAKADHTATVRHAQQQAQATALVAGFAPVPDIPFHDPGESTRQAAQDLLARARAQLATSGDQAQDTVAHGRDQAPPGPAWWQQAWRQVRGYQTGVYESSRDIVTFAWSTSTLRMVADPIGYAHTVATLAQGARYATQHPIEFGKAVADWDAWQTNPARALGHLAPDIAMAVASAGSAPAVTRGTRSATTISTLDAAPRVDPIPDRIPTRQSHVEPADTVPIRAIDRTSIPPDSSFGPAGHPSPAPAPVGSWRDGPSTLPGYTLDKHGRLVQSVDDTPDGPWWYPDFDEPEVTPSDPNIDVART